jgi:ribosomal protein S27E
MGKLRGETVPQTFYYQVEYKSKGKTRTCGHRHTSEAGCSKCLTNLARPNGPAPKVRAHVSYS